MQDLVSRGALRRLAEVSIDALLAGEHVSIAHAQGWVRPASWPLPAVRTRIGEPQPYRPLAILEYIHDALRGAPSESDWRDLV